MKTRVFDLINGHVAQQVEAEDLKSSQYGFESHRGYQFVQFIILLSDKAERRLAIRTDEMIMRVSILASAMVSKTVRLGSSPRPAAIETQTANLFKEQSVKLSHT